MSMRHTVNRGDCLWNLAHRYLGSGTKFPDIVQHHNQYVSSLGRHTRWIAIDDPNIIYVGQTIMIPPRIKGFSPGTGIKTEASAIATELGCKVEYNFEEGTNPIKYIPYVTPNYTILTEMTGKITFENLTIDNAMQSFKFSTALDKGEIVSKMTFNDRALTELTKSVEPQFDMNTGRIKLKASIATKANIGPYTFEAEMDTPNHLKATFKPDPISATVKMGKGKYKFSADIAFKVDITLHPMNRDKQPQNVPNPFPKQAPANSKDNVSILGIAGLITASILIYIFGPKGPLSGTGGPMPRYAPASPMPLMHHINSHNSLPES